MSVKMAWQRVKSVTWPDRIATLRQMLLAICCSINGNGDVKND